MKNTNLKIYKVNEIVMQDYGIYIMKIAFLGYIYLVVYSWLKIKFLKDHRCARRSECTFRNEKYKLHLNLQIFLISSNYEIRHTKEIRVSTERALVQHILQSDSGPSKQIILNKIFLIWHDIIANTTIDRRNIKRNYNIRVSHLGYSIWIYATVPNAFQLFSLRIVFSNFFLFVFSNPQIICDE